MNLIACVDKNWGIGRGGKLLVQIPRDMKLFREETLGKTIIMGRNTLESLPGGAPLYDRENIVLSSDVSLKISGAVVLSGVKECIDYIKLNGTAFSDVFVIGGERVYRDFLPYCDSAHITFVDFNYEADRYLENLDESDDWSLSMESDEETYFDIEYSFRLYKRIRNGVIKQTV